LFWRLIVETILVLGAAKQVKYSSGNLVWSLPEPVAESN